MKLTLICTCVLFVLSCNLAVSTAYPTTYYIDGDFRDFDDTYNYRGSRLSLDDSDVDDTYNYYRNSRLRRIDDSDSDDTYNYRNSRLRRINDYDDNNSVYYKYDTRRAPTRREDSESDVVYKYTPLVRYKSTRTQRKKLFVPNLFG